jgi:hypothetical protein
MMMVLALANLTLTLYVGIVNCGDLHEEKQSKGLQSG